ncbi:MAG TPA: hypothetical protein VJ201_06945 [Candidatus Babeliales bacterium]|nr:hypothetical protein [Candidatus Babeliales bacterium]
MRFSIIFLLFFNISLFTMHKPELVDGFVLVDARIDYAKTLKMAIETHHIQTLTEVCKKMHPDLQKKLPEIDFTPLEFTVKECFKFGVDLLLSYGVLVTPYAIQLSLLKRHKPILQSLVIRAPLEQLADICVESGLSHIEFAVKQNYPDGIEFLLKHKVAISERALQLSLKTDNSIVVRLLLSHGAQVTLKVLEIAVMGQHTFCLGDLLINGGNLLVTQALIASAQDLCQDSDFHVRRRAQFIVELLKSAKIQEQKSR